MKNNRLKPKDILFINGIALSAYSLTEPIAFT